MQVLRTFLIRMHHKPDFDAKVVGATFAVCIFAGPALLAIGVFMWLESGRWAPVETTWLFEVFPAFAGWIENPRSWFGAHKVIKLLLALPLGIL